MSLRAEWLSQTATIHHLPARQPAFRQNLGRRQKLVDPNLKFSSNFTERGGGNPVQVYCFHRWLDLPQFIQSRLVLSFSKTDSTSQLLGTFWSFFFFAPVYFYFIIFWG